MCMNVEANGNDAALLGDWRWTTLGELVHQAQNGLSKRRGSGTPTHVLRLADIANGAIDESSPRDIELTSDYIAKYSLQCGDRLCIRVNGIRGLTGCMVHFSARQRWTYCDHFIRFKLNKSADPKYIAHFFNTEKARTHLDKHTVSTADQNTVSQPTMLSVPVPLASIDQQECIVAELEKQISRLRNVSTSFGQSFES
jgi:type I restriction enzyme S subunit